MCIILHKNVGAEIPFESLVRCAERNSDGWGVMVSDRGKLEVFRGQSNKASTHAEEVQKVLEIAKDLPLMVHFRFATVGAKDVSNCHPFPLLDEEDGVDLQLMHNGTMSYFKVDGNKISDTARFVEGVAKPMLKRYWAYAKTQEGDPVELLLKDQSLKEALGAMVGSHGVLTLLAGSGQSLRIHPANGKVHEWGWASNGQDIAPRKPFKDTFRETETPGIYAYSPSGSSKAVTPWTPPESWKSGVTLAKTDSLADQAKALQDIIKSNPNTACVLPQPGIRMDSGDFLGRYSLSDLAYLNIADIRDLVYNCPEAAAMCMIDMIHRLFVDPKTSRVKNDVTWSAAAKENPNAF